MAYCVRARQSMLVVIPNEGFMSAAYNPNKLGWGAAALTCLVTASLWFTAYTIHKNTYRHPRDPMNAQVYRDRDAAAETHDAGKGDAAAGADKGAPSKPSH